MTAHFRTDALIDGKWTTGGPTFPIHNPATGAVVAHAPDLGAAETQAAIAAAHAALPAWSGLLAKERAAIIRKWGELMLRDGEALAQLITAECGKPISEARGEVPYAASFCEWFAEEAKRAYGRTIPTTAAQRRYITVKQPVGVVAAITPWNFPLGMVTRKAAPALAAGCTVVLKPAEATPLSAIAVAELAIEAGVPPGVLNIITSNQAAVVGKALTESPLVRKLSFTGSTAVGKLLAAQCAPTVKRVSLELGGNAPFVIFADADLEKAASAVMQAKFRNAGQTCVCANRVLVQAEIYDAFAKLLAQKAASLKVGDGAGADVQMGPLINARAVEKVERLVAAALGAGAKALTGGQRHGAGAQFFTPTVLTGVTPDMAVAREEIFGPVAGLIRFETEGEAVQIANDTPYGLAAYVFTENLSRAWRVAERLSYGMVSLNEGLMTSEATPFGGVKESGLGREGGQEGLDEFLDTKFISFSGIAG